MKTETRVYTPHLGIVNKLELASNLAHNSVLNELGISPDSEEAESVWVERDGAECFYYTEVAQNIFNRWYDYYLSEIEKTEE